MEEVFKKANICEGVNVDGENLTHLRFADDVALFNEKNKQTKNKKQKQKQKKPWKKTLKHSELRESEL